MNNYFRIDLSGGNACFIDKPSKEQLKVYGDIYEIADLIKKKPIDKKTVKVFEFSLLKIWGRKSNILGSYFGLSNGFFLSKRALTTIKKFKIAPHLIFPAKFINEPFEYYFLFFLTDLIEKVDFKRSTFGLKNIETYELIESNLKFSTRQGFYKNKYPKGTMSAHYFQNVFLLGNNYDLFILKELEGGIFCSNELKKQLLKEKITGVKFRESIINRIE